MVNKTPAVHAQHSLPMMKKLRFNEHSSLWLGSCYVMTIRPSPWSHRLQSEDQGHAVETASLNTAAKSVLYNVLPGENSYKFVTWLGVAVVEFS